MLNIVVLMFSEWLRKSIDNPKIKTNPFRGNGSVSSPTNLLNDSQFVVSSFSTGYRLNGDYYEDDKTYVSNNSSSIIVFDVQHKKDLFYERYLKFHWEQSKIFAMN